MALDTSRPRSRRALLAAAAGAAAATAASAPRAARPGERGLGGLQLRLVRHRGRHGDAHRCERRSADGVYGVSFSTSGIGVRGWAHGASGSTYGVYGLSESTDGGCLRPRRRHQRLHLRRRGSVLQHERHRHLGPLTPPTSGSTRGVDGRPSARSGIGVRGYAHGASGSTYGVYGLSGSTSGTGVYGYARATTGYTYGVSGLSESTSGFGVCGRNAANSTGVLGTSSDIAQPVVPIPSPKTGVYGYAAQDRRPAGCGRDDVGRGGPGLATTGYGVRGGHLGIGASGYARPAPRCSPPRPTPRWAPRSRRSARSSSTRASASRPSPPARTQVTVTPGIDLTATSAVVATLQGSAGGALVNGSR